MQGILCPALTPFTPDLTVDFSRLELEIDYIIDVCRADAVLIAGVETQEYQALDLRARMEYVERSLAFVAGRVPAVVGVTHPNQRTSLALAEHAQRHGASVLMAMATLKPWGAAPSRSEVLAWFRTLAREASVPILVYNNPRFGFDLSVDLMVELTDIPRVRYFKETSRDMGKLGRLLAEIDGAGRGRCFATMETLLPSLLLGSAGGMMPPPAAKVGKEIVEAYRAGDLVGAVAGQKVFSVFPSRWLSRGLLPAMKAAMALVGVDVGDPLPPYEPLSPAEREEMATVLSSAGLTRGPA